MKTTQNIIVRTILSLFITFTFTYDISAAHQKNISKTSKKQTSASLFTSTMPTTSIYEKSIEEIYGKNGLNIDQTDIIQIQQTYAYIEMMVKLHKISTDPTLAQYKTLFANMAASNKNNTRLTTQEMLHSKEWNLITITPTDIQTSDIWQLYIKSAIVDYYENQHDFIETMTMIQSQMFPYLANIELNFYNNDFIQLRKLAELLRVKKILQDRVLQECLQSCIDWKDKDQATIDVNVADFKLTDFYRYTHDTTTWKTTSKLGHPLEEYVMTYFMLTTIQSTIQKKFTQKNLFAFLTQASSLKLSPNFFDYLPSDFVCLDYILTLQNQLHGKQSGSLSSSMQSFNLSDLVDTSKINRQDQNVIIQKSSNPFKKIGKSITHIADDAGKGISDVAKSAGKDIADASNIVGAGIADTATVVGTNISDTAQHVGNAIADAPENIAHSAVSTAQDTGQGLEQTMNATGKDLDVKDIAHATVDASLSIGHGLQGVGQGIAGSAAISVGAIAEDKNATAWGKKENKAAAHQMKESGKEFNKTISTLAKMALFSAVTHGVEGMALGAAGFGATMIGDIIYAQTGNKTIKNWGEKESKKATDDLQVAGKDVDTVIDNTAKALEDGIIAPIALIEGNAIGFVTQDKKIGQDMTMIMNQVCDSAINLGATTLTSVNNITNTGLVAMYKLSESYYEIMVDAMMVVYGETTGQKSVANRSVAMTTSTAKGFAKNIIQAATTNFSCIITSTMDIVMGVAAVMAAVTNSLTTIIFDTVREITFLGCDFGELMGAPVNAAQERDKISAKMEAHRSTINIVTSTVLMVAITVLTLGAAAPEAGVVMSAEIGTDVAVETTMAVTTDVTTTTATDVAMTTTTEATTEGATLTTEQASLATEQGTKNASLLATYGGEMLGQTINLIFSAFSIISADNQDEAAIKMLAQEKASIMNLWGFIEDNKVVMTHNQNLYLDELHKKHQVAVENQTFGLNYYANYLNSSINNIQNQISHALSQEYIGMLTPDSNGSRMADIGSTWGLTTPFIYLYPSQGFLTTTLGRPDFPYAQEIAQAALIAQNQDSGAQKNNLDTTKKEPLKSWFNQRAIAHVNQAIDTPLFVEIQLRIIYNLTSDFYVGLYLGGKYYDYYAPEYLTDIQNSGGIHLDDAHLAKMFVLKRENNEKIPSLGVYENEGKGWIMHKTIDTNLLNNSSIYHMSATLNKHQLTVSFWPANDPLKKWSSTVVVTPSDQRTFGVIFSGAAVEWNVVKPTMPIHQNNKVRTALNAQPEADRERAAKKLWTNLKNPIFGSIKLTTIGKKYLMQGQYLYTTQDTKLTDIHNNIITDTLAFATYTEGKITNIGVSAITTDVAKKPNAIISMISGNIYDENGNILDTKENPWPLFMKNNGPFDQTLITSIQTTQKIIPQKQAPENSSTIISLHDMTTNISPSTGGFQFGLSNKVPTINNAPKSFDTRQATAATGSTVQVGGLGTNISMSDVNVGSSGFSL